MNRRIQYAIMAMAIFCSFNGAAQILATFEEYNLRPGEYRNNASPEKGWQSGAIELPNVYDPDFDYWEGWAISADTNATTPGFLNQYSVRFGRGANASTTYAVGYLYGAGIVRNVGDALNRPMTGFYVTNTTYAYFSMRDGDAFAKKFGGETGNDPDFFKLTIKKYHGGLLGPDSINVFLADYRFSNNAQDYILDEWQYVDLSVFGRVDSLQLTLSSSDNGAFGMNTPAYLAIDNVGNDILLSASALRTTLHSLAVHPNPAAEHVYLTLEKPGKVTFTTLHGIEYWSSSLEPGHHQVPVMDWPRGMYFILLDGVVTNRVSLQ